MSDRDRLIELLHGVISRCYYPTKPCDHDSEDECVRVMIDHLESCGWGDLLAAVEAQDAVIEQQAKLLDELGYRRTDEVVSKRELDVHLQLHRLQMARQGHRIKELREQLDDAREHQHICSEIIASNEGLGEALVLARMALGMVVSESAQAVYTDSGLNAPWYEATFDFPQMDLIRQGLGQKREVEPHD